MLVRSTPSPIAPLHSGSLAMLVAQRKAQTVTFLLIDCSWSMSHPASGIAGLSKMSALRNVVKELNNDGLRPRMVGFGLTHSRGPKSVGFVEYVPEPVGSTPLAQAIDFAQRFGAGHLIVVSDGAPDDPEAALTAAKLFGGPVDVFYCGPRPNAGEQFLQQLAAASGGHCQSVSLSSTKELSSGLKRMLTA